MYLFNVLLKTDINRIQFWCNWGRTIRLLSRVQYVSSNAVSEQKDFSGVLVMWAEVTQAVI